MSLVWLIFQVVCVVAPGAVRIERIVGVKYVPTLAAGASQRLAALAPFADVFVAYRGKTVSATDADTTGFGDSRGTFQWILGVAGEGIEPPILRHAYIVPIRAYSFLHFPCHILSPVTFGYTWLPFIVENTPSSGGLNSALPMESFAGNRLASESGLVKIHGAPESLSPRGL